MTVVTQRTPSEREWGDLTFAWRVAKHVGSNAIVVAKDLATVGIGAGQMSRVDAVRIALSKAQQTVEGASLASDAFFPFDDGPKLALDAGVRVHPARRREARRRVIAPRSTGTAPRWSSPGDGTSSYDRDPPPPASRHAGGDGTIPPVRGVPTIIDLIAHTPIIRSRSCSPPGLRAFAKVEYPTRAARSRDRITACHSVRARPSATNSAARGGTILRQAHLGSRWASRPGPGRGTARSYHRCIFLMPDECRARRLRCCGRSDGGGRLPTEDRGPALITTRSSTPPGARAPGAFNPSGTAIPANPLHRRTTARAGDGGGSRRRAPLDDIS